VDDEQALAQIRNAVEILERHDRERRTLGPGSSIRTAHMTVEVVGQDVIAIPFYYAAHKVRSEITRRPSATSGASRTRSAHG
jgi:hypothetical protein